MVLKKKLSPPVLFENSEAEAKKPLEINIPLNVDDSIKLLQQLQTREIELELKNEELTRENEELKNSLKTFSDFYHNSSIAFLRVDENSLIREINQMASDLFGINPASLNSFHFDNFIPRDSGISLKKIISTAIRERKSLKCALKLINTSDITFPALININLSSFKDEVNITVIPGNKEFLNGSEENLIKQKQTETEFELHQIKKRELERTAELEAMLEAVPAAVWIAKDPDANYISGNKASSEICRVTKDTNMSKNFNPDILTFKVLKNNLELQPHEMPIQRAAKGEIIKNYQFELLFPDNSLIYLFGNATPLLNEQGQSRGAVAAFVDITNIKVTEKKLKNSERSFKSLAENAPDIIMRLDTNFRVTYINSEIERITGKAADQFLCKTSEEIGVPEHLCNLWNCAFEKALSTKTVQEIEFDFETKEGVKSFNLRIVAETSDDGAVESLLGITRDVTLRKRWEKTIRESEHNFKYAESIAHTGSYQHDLKTDICKWSDEFFRICGLEPQSIKTNKNVFLSIIHPEDRDLIECSIQNALINKGGFRDEYRIVRPGGEVRNIISVGHVIVDENSEPKEIKGAFLDITDLRKAELSLKESEENYRMLFESMPVGLAISDACGKITYGNKKSRILLGISRTELKQGAIDISRWKFISRDGIPIKPDELPNMKVLKENRTIENTEIGIIKENDSLTWLNVTVAPLQNREEVLLAFIDISEKIQREKQLEELSVKLRELNATKDKFFSIIAHDLKNPFNSILGFSELLIKNISKYSTEEVERFMGIINGTSQSAYDLLENLLNWSRSQTGTIEFCPSVYNLIELIDSNIEFVENQAFKKSISIFFEEEGICKVEIDKNMIDTVLRNILTNAIKFSYPGGKIIINIEDMDEFYQVSIEDNGIGIEKDNIDKLFRIESKYSSYGTNQEKGSGLGLIICKEFVEKNKGEIWVISEFGKGSEFLFTLPKIRKDIL